MTANSHHSVRDDSAFDYVLVGGGLQNALIALALRERQPDVSVALVERDSEIGGNHTWCFHRGDISYAAEAFISPLVEHRWDGYHIRFPNLDRKVETPYAALTSRWLDSQIRRCFESRPHWRLLLGCEAAAVDSHQVRLASGHVLNAEVVIDSRGPSPQSEHCGYQKFVGLEVELEAPHGLTVPTLMDATVEQADGFRFIYTLPFTPTSLLIEDTYFSDTPILDQVVIEGRILEYAKKHNVAIAAIVRREHGVLPMPWRGDFETPTQSPLRAGYGGGWFHPATGYSFPVACRLAEVVAGQPPSQLFGSNFNDLCARHREQVRYCHRLNRMLFSWFAPSDRWHVFERFYGLSEPMIRRFYALDLTPMDRARLLVGRPPRGLSIRTAIARRHLFA